jgi:hypothetical protein
MAWSGPLQVSAFSRLLAGFSKAGQLLIQKPQKTVLQQNLKRQAFAGENFGAPGWELQLGVGCEQSDRSAIMKSWEH